MANKQLKVSDNEYNSRFHDSIERDKDRVSSTGEVFTPLKLVDEILNNLPRESFTDATKTFIDPAAGNGNFIVQVIRYKIHYNKNDPNRVYQALYTTYAVELMQDNVERIKERIYGIADDFDDTILGVAQAEEKYGMIVNNNIICHDSLTLDYDTIHPYDSKKTKPKKKLTNIEKQEIALFGRILDKKTK